MLSILGDIDAWTYITIDMLLFPLEDILLPNIVKIIVQPQPIQRMKFDICCLSYEVGNQPLKLLHKCLVASCLLYVKMNTHRQFISQVTLKLQPGKRTREGPAAFSVLLESRPPSFLGVSVYMNHRSTGPKPVRTIFGNSVEYEVKVTLDDCLIYTSKWWPKVALNASSPQ